MLASPHTQLSKKMIRVSDSFFLPAYGFKGQLVVLVWFAWLGVFAFWLAIYFVVFLCWIHLGLFQFFSTLYLSASVYRDILIVVIVVRLHQLCHSEAGCLLPLQKIENCDCHPTVSWAL